MAAPSHPGPAVHRDPPGMRVARNRAVEFGARTCVVRRPPLVRTACGSRTRSRGTAAAAARAEVRDVRGVVESAGDGLALGDLELLEARAAPWQVVAVPLQHRRHGVQPLQRRSQFCLVVVHQTGQLLRHRRRVGQQSTMACAASTSTPSRSLALRINVFTCWLRSERTPVTSTGALEQIAQCFVAAVQRLATAGSARRTSDRVAARPDRASSDSVSSD